MKNFFIVASFIFIIVLLTGCSNGISKEVNLDKIDWIGYTNLDRKYSDMIE